MTVLSRGAAGRRSARRPGWVLLSALLLFVIGASSVLVFSDRVQLLRLAVILALWAAVIAAFASMTYRRQADVDKAQRRDLKLVYDLQLDREVSARREYELALEAQLRRELASELRAEAADEVAALRADLAALRTSLEILFDTELDHRPALETDRAAAGGYPDWAENESTPADWVASDRVTSVRRQDAAARSEEAAIIDVPEEPLMPSRPVTLESAAPPRPPEWLPTAAEQASRHGRPSGRDEVGGDEVGSDQVGRDTPDEPHARHPADRRARHSTEPRDDDTDVISVPWPSDAPTWTPAAPDTSLISSAVESGARHRTTDAPSGDAPQSGGQSVADLLARLHAEPTGGGRRRRRRRV